MAHAIFSQTLQVNNYFHLDHVSFVFISQRGKCHDVTVSVAFMAEEE